MFFNLLYTLPHQINSQAEAINSPAVPFPVKLPEFAYQRTAHSTTKTPPSFVLVSPGPLVDNDSWDFIVAHKGKEKVESIDVMLVDVNKLEHIQKTTAPGVGVLPQEYSVFVHIDQMFPKGRGSLFARQFLWKPFSLEHGHYRADISASTGRFHEELYIEKVNDKWKYAAKVTDIDTHDSRFVCRDEMFPVSVAPEIVARGKCWPEMIQ